MPLYFDPGSFLGWFLINFAHVWSCTSITCQLVYMNWSNYLFKFTLLISVTIAPSNIWTMDVDPYIFSLLRLPRLEYIVQPMVLISDIGAHVWCNLCYLICLRHLIRLRAGTARIFFSEKIWFPLCVRSMIWSTN